MTSDNRNPDHHPQREPQREVLLTDLAAECGHLALRPCGEADAYVCDTCQRELTTIEAEEASSEATFRGVHGMHGVPGVPGFGDFR